MKAPSQWIVAQLGKDHNRLGFSCGNEALERYLKERAGQDARRRVAAPFVLVSTSDPKTILGYYTLSSFGIDLEDLPPDIIKKLPAYPVVPVTLLGRLAVGQRYRDQSLGEFQLLDALKRAFMLSSQIATAAVVVDALDEQASGFYRYFGFIPFPDKSSRLFLPMKTIAALFTRTPGQK